MPAGDRRGPIGSGPMTGRGAGYCAGYSVPGYANDLRGGGYSGAGRGGRGFRNRFYSTGRFFQGRGFQDSPFFYQQEFPYSRPEFSADSEIKLLKKQAEFMEREMAAINDRIKELEPISSIQKQNV